MPLAEHYSRKHYRLGDADTGRTPPVVASPDGDGISDTGMRGFLKWAKREYPTAIYQKIAQDIHQALPQAFNGYMLGGWRAQAKRSGFADATPTVDTADAANSTAIDPTWSNIINNLIGTATGAYLDIRQQQQQQQVINAQLQNAQAGKSPLPISLSSNGITFGQQAGIGAAGVLVAGVLGFFALKAFGVIR